MQVRIAMLGAVGVSAEPGNYLISETSTATIIASPIDGVGFIGAAFVGRFIDKFGEGFDAAAEAYDAATFVLAGFGPFTVFVFPDDTLGTYPGTATFFVARFAALADRIGDDTLFVFKEAFELIFATVAVFAVHDRLGDALKGFGVEVAFSLGLAGGL